MLHPADPKRPDADRDRDANPWPLLEVLVALAVIGPLVLAVGLALLVAAAG